MVDLEMWWPSPGAFDVLSVEDAESGLTLSAPENSECAAWLNFWNQSDEHHQFFTGEFVGVLNNYLTELETKNGKG